MKVSKLFFAFALATLVFTSCTKEEDPIINPEPFPTIQSELEGVWNFKESSCECAYHGIFENGDYLWEFTVTGTIELELNVTVNENAGVPFLSDSNVNYSLNSNEITIDGTTYEYHIDGEDLFIYLMPESDGPNWKLAR